MTNDLFLKLVLGFVLLLPACKDDEEGVAPTACAFECVAEDACSEPSIPHSDMSCEEEGMVCCERAAAGDDTSTDTATDSGEAEADTETATGAPADTDSTTLSTDSETIPGPDTETETATTPLDTGDTGTGQGSGVNCDEAIVVGELPFSHDGTTVGATNDYRIDADSCEGVTDAKGGGSNDVVYRFTPPASAVYIITVDGFDAAPYLVTDCETIETACIAGVDDAGEGRESLVLELEAGTAYFIIVDGWSDSRSLNVSGAYTLTVSEPCTPSCDNKACGDDGCGRSCGTCEDGFACNLDGECQEDTTEGSSCTYAHPVTELPFTATGDTTGMSNLYGAKAGDCPGIEEEDIGYGSNDEVYALTPTVAGRYTITLDGDFDSALIVATDCDVVSTSCVGGVNTASASETLVLDLRADTAYYIVVDGFDVTGNESGTYTLTISDVCVPDCDEKNCGDDGCGDICGTCAETEICNDDQVCEVYAGHGDACDDPYIVDGVPYTKSSSTVLPGDDFSYGTDACPGDINWGGNGSGDEVYAFTPDVRGAYTIAVLGDFDATVYVVSDCADVDNSCLVVGTVAGPGREEVTVMLEADTPYYIIVDGDAIDVTLEGNYTLTISEPCIPECTGLQCGDDGCGFSCGECEPGYQCTDEGLCNPFNTYGDSCINPFEVPSVPYLDAGDTTDMNNVYMVPDDACSEGILEMGTASNDAVYEFTPAATGVYTIDVDSEVFTPGVYVVTDCTDTGGACIGGESFSLAEDELLVVLEADVTYAIIVDAATWTSAGAGAYTLSVSEPCLRQCDGRQCGDDGCGVPCGECAADEFCDIDGQCRVYDGDGDTCEGALLVDAVPFSAAGDTSLATNDYDFIEDECPGVIFSGTQSQDEVYAFTPTELGAYTISISAESHHPTVYVATDCASIGTSCVNAVTANAGESASMDVQMAPETTYYIIVDGFGNSTAQDGPYTVSISEPCLPECGGKDCGDDGCGFPCGECSADEFCDEDGLCQTPETPGDSCANPIVVDDATFPVSYDTSATGFSNLYEAAADACTGLDSGGADANDMAFSFTPQTTGWYTIQTDDTFNNIVYVTTNCTDIGNACLAGARGEPFDVLLTAGVEFFIIVDGSASQSGVFELTVSDVCERQCDGKFCGDDGCGHPCGLCDAGEFCDTDWTCQPLMDEGDSCFAPIVIPADNPDGYEDADRSTVDMNNGYSADDIQCSGITNTRGTGSNDVVYQFTPATTGYYTIAAIPDFDAAVYVTTDCQDLETACVGGFERIAGSMTPELTADQDYYIIVDGYGKDDVNTTGTFTLTVSDVCVPACDGKECGDDGCGFSCGDCGTDAFCDLDDLCQVSDVPGDTCTQPFEIDYFDSPMVGDTSLLNNVYGFGPYQCADLLVSTRGMGSKDAVYSLPVTSYTQGAFTIEVYSDFDATIYLLDEACDMASSCLAAVDDVLDYDTETLALDFLGVGQYYIIVDGWSNDYDSSGYYNVTLRQGLPDAK